MIMVRRPGVEPDLPAYETSAISNTARHALSAMLFINGIKLITPFIKTFFNLCLQLDPPTEHWLE